MEEVTGSIPVRSTDSLLIKRNINYLDFSGIIWHSSPSSLTRIVEMGFREATNCFSEVHLNSEKAFDQRLIPARRSYLMSDQRTSSTVVDPAEDQESGIAKQWNRMIADFESEFTGGPAKLELAKGHPEVKSRFFAFLHQLADERAALLPFEQRPVWKTVKVGTHKSKKDLKKATEDEGHKFSDWAADLFNQKKFPLSNEERTVELYTATVAELGFKEGATVKEIYAKLDSLGFGVCPHETAVQLRRVYKDQPMNEWRIVITEPVADSDGGLAVLLVGRNSYASWVGRGYARPGSRWHADNRLVFCRK